MSEERGEREVSDIMKSVDKSNLLPFELLRLEMNKQERKKKEEYKPL